MNFVIFMPDEWRAESAGCYGHPLVKTPHLDRLAEEGTRFGQCYAQHPVCSPSRASMFTGWYPHIRGHRTLWHLLRPDEPNLFKYLTAAGYDVRWYGKNDLLSQESFATSVTEALYPRGRGRFGPRVASDPEDPRYDSFLAHPFVGEAMETSDAACVQMGMDFLRSAHKKPFLLYLPLVLPHPPYSAPEPYHHMYAPQEVPPLRPKVFEGKPMFHRLIHQTRRLDRLTEEDFRKIAAIYLGQITYMDFLLGEVLKTLDETGLADDTCVIVISDHGDWAGEFGLVEKWPSALDDTILRMPLVMRMPGGVAAHIVDTPVELFDIMATILELAGVAAEHTHFAKSLVPQLSGARGDEERAAFAQGGYDPHEPHCFEGRSVGTYAQRGPDNIYYQKGLLQQTHPASVCRAVMIRTATHKLIYRTSDTCELYHMRADPRELENLYGCPEAAELQRKLERRLLDFYLHTSDVTPREEDPRGLPEGGFRAASLAAGRQDFSAERR